MTEEEWLGCDDPRVLLPSLQEGTWEPWPFSCACYLTDCRGGGGLCPAYRKLRLFSCAACRRVLHMLPDPVCLTALEAAERYADGEMEREPYIAASAAFDTVRRARFPKYETPDDEAWNALYCAVHRRWDEFADSWYALQRCELAAAVARDAIHANGPDEARALAGVLRDVVGNPSRPVSFEPAWATPTALSLAEAAYQERLLPGGQLDPVRMAVLADALEDSGCDNRQVLEHCRHPAQVHVRGCWVIDLLTARS